jgi:hypothetical protein
MPGVFPDYPAPVIRESEGGREMLMMRWGMPPPPQTGGPPVTNIRNTSSRHWRGWLRPEHRCLVPFNSFAEYAPEANPETKKRMTYGLPMATIVRCRPLQACGPSSREIVALSQSLSPGRIWSTPNDLTQRDRRAHPPQGYAPDHRGGARCLDARAVG